MADHLTDEPTKHWTGTEQPLTGIIRIDGKPHRFMGTLPRNAGAIPVVTQTSLSVTPTATRYEFEASGIELKLTFLTPALPHDLDVLSRPVTYVLFDVRSQDGKSHAVSLYFDASAALAVNTPDQPVVASRHQIGDLQVLRTGSTEQPMLAKSGDNLRIDWGYFYLAVPGKQSATSLLVGNPESRSAYLKTGKLPESDDLELPRPARKNQPLLSVAFDLGKVGNQAVSRRLMLAYDDFFSIEYLQRKLRPYWRRNGLTAAGLLQAAEKDFENLKQRSQRFDEELTEDLSKAGGPAYAQLAILAYRQTLAAHKLVADLNGTPLYFSKENFSNGCIDTVDVTYPSAPFFLLFNPDLLKGQLKPILDYASLPRWRFPFAPHDLGTYPLANGQVYGGGEENEINQMPVEESGNMLLLMAALAKVEGNADFSAQYWPLLSKWAAYLREKGLDPENQLSTDDFAGHLAHNTNLSLKAILALRGYALLAETLGKQSEASTYKQASEEMATRWVKMADDGDHYRLAFDKPGTWSQKYNLVWDKLLGFNLFPKTIAEKELAFYRTKQNQYGLPLDNREMYTKLDWIVWTATLSDNPSDFSALIDPLGKWINETPSRVPLTDWYTTTDGRQKGFQARSVVGGVFIKLLSDETSRKKWNQRASQTGSPSQSSQQAGR